MKFQFSNLHRNSHPKPWRVQPSVAPVHVDLRQEFSRSSPVALFVNYRNCTNVATPLGLLINEVSVYNSSRAKQSVVQWSSIPRGADDTRYVDALIASGSDFSLFVVVSTRDTGCDEQTSKHLRAKASKAPRVMR